MKIRETVYIINNYTLIYTYIERLSLSEFHLLHCITLKIFLLRVLYL